ncbi:Tripartite tricarboxylate transporter family receptor [compost metagenome]
MVAVPRGTPAAVKKALADATKAVMGTPAMATTLSEQGIFADLHIGDAPASAYVKAETAKWKPVVAQLGGAGAIGQ